MARSRWSALVAVFITLAASALARADGLIVIRDPPPSRVVGHFAFAPLEVAYHHVTVTIDAAGVATTNVDQEFYNPNPQRLEGTYLFPLPEGATVDRFAMDIDGKTQEAELLSADKARATYEDIVRRQRDPALLEYVGRGAFKVRVFPIEPNGRKHVQLRYTQLIRPDNGTAEYVYPLNTEKFSARPLADVSVKVELTTAAPIKNVYCPSHPVDVRRDGPTRAIVGFEARDVRPDTDFKLVWSTDKDPVGVSLLTYQTGPDDGYFLLMASPGGGAADDADVQPRDVCFVLDTSGSMAGAKLEQAKRAMRFCLANLSPADRFEVVRFSTEAEGLFDGLVPADADHVRRATTFVDGLRAMGGTAISDALGRAEGLFAAADRGRPATIIFLTDGQPTVGETDEDKLVASVPDGGPVRVFAFGIGTDVNTHLLDRLAGRTHAASQYVLPEEDIEVKVSTFYGKIRSPVLSNVRVAFGTGVRVSQMYPRDLPDLFKGETLTVFGRYSGGGTAKATVTGTMSGATRTFAGDVRFAKEDVSHGFIPRLWATRRVGWLLDQIRLHGESTELRDEIVSLARAHGIVTPYTSYLILEDERRRNVPLSMQTQRELGADAPAADRARSTYESARHDSRDLEKDGRRGVDNSVNADSLAQAQSEQQAQQQYALQKTAATATTPMAGGGEFGGTLGPTTQPTFGYRQAQNFAQQVRVVNGRAFYQNGTVWTDAAAQDPRNAKRQSVAFGTDAYFALLAQHPNAAAWLSLGDEVDLVLDGTVYSVRNGEQKN